MTEFETNYLAHHGITGQVTNVAFSDIDVNTTDFLEHYQIKGAKHGIRRFQNFDGTLTAEGRARYGIGPAREKKSDEETSGNSKKTQKSETKLKKVSHEKLKEYLRDHPKKLPRYKRALTEDEANEIIRKINFDRKLEDIRQSEIQRGRDRFASTVKYTSDLSKFMTNGTIIYDRSASIINALADAGVISSDKLPLINKKSK